MAKLVLMAFARCLNRQGSAWSGNQARVNTNKKMMASNAAPSEKIIVV
jgi:hypothetical protein